MPGGQDANELPPGRGAGSGAPPPPWARYPGTVYREFWMACADPYVHSTWLPFWNALAEEERAEHLARFPPAPGWRGFLDEVAFQQELDAIDAHDIATGVLQPNGLAWPAPEPVRLPFWRRLREWMR